jgi:hypothetical protein
MKPGLSCVCRMRNVKTCDGVAEVVAFIEKRGMLTIR